MWTYRQNCFQRRFLCHWMQLCRNLKNSQQNALLMRTNFLSTSVRFWTEWELQGALTTIYKHVNFLLAHFLKPFPSHAASRTSPWKVGRTGNKQGRTGENHKHEQLDDTNIILCAKTAEYSREGWVNPLWDDRKTQYLHKLVCAISY